MEAKRGLDWKFSSKQLLPKGGSAYTDAELANLKAMRMQDEIVLKNQASGQGAINHSSEAIRFFKARVRAINRILDPIQNSGQ